MPISECLRRSLWWTRRSPPFAQQTHTPRNIFGWFYVHEKKKKQNKENQKIIIIQKRGKGGFRPYLMGQGPFLLFSPPSFSSSFSYFFFLYSPLLLSILFLSSLFFLLSSSFSLFQYFPLFSRISIKHRKSDFFQIVNWSGFLTHH